MIHDICRRIERAFDGVPQPKILTLFVAEAHDDYIYDKDAEIHKTDYIGKWQDIPIEHIIKCQNALSYLDEIGIRFYLPAYMTWYLRHHLDKKIVTSDHALYSLDNHSDIPELGAYYSKRFKLFSDVQMDACSRFVEYCALDKSGFIDCTFAEAIFRSHWAKYKIE